MVFLSSTLLANASMDPLQSRVKKLDVRLVAPSAGCPPRVYQKAKEYLRSSLPNPLNTQDPLAQVFVDPGPKAGQLDAALRSGSHILWTLRGGYGASKIVATLHRKFRYNCVTPKVIIGYSDTTVLHIYFAEKYGWQGISACNFFELCTQSKSDQTRRLIVDFLTGKTDVLTLERLMPLNPPAWRATQICGTTTGGNMTMLQDTLGTPWQVVGQSRIIFLEDVNVHGHYLDRALHHLKNAGVFERAYALVFGDFAAEDLAIIRAFVATLPLPAFHTPLFGHGEENHPIGINFWGRIVKTASGNFKVFMTRTSPN